MTIDNLPNDIDELKKLVLKTTQELFGKDQEIQALKDTIFLLQMKEYLSHSLLFLLMELQIKQHFLQE